MLEVLVTGYLLVIAFLVVLVVLWFCLSFAVFGTKARLVNITELLERQNRLLARLLDE